MNVVVGATDLMAKAFVFSTDCCNVRKQFVFDYCVYPCMSMLCAKDDV